MKTIKITVQYRDGDNYKNTEEQYFSNLLDRPFSLIEERLEDLMDKPIMVQDYGLRSIAPLENEFENTPPDSPDHAYCEIIEVEGIDKDMKTQEDIERVLELIGKGGDKKAALNRRANANRKLQDYAMAGAILSHHMFDKWYLRNDGGAMDTHALIAQIATEFENEHRNVDDWEEFTHEKGSSDWEEYLIDWAEKKRLELQNAAENANGVCLEILGYKDSQIQTTSYENFIHFPDKEKALEYVKSCKALMAYEMCDLYFDNKYWGKYMRGTLYQADKNGMVDYSKPIRQTMAVFGSHGNMIVDIFSGEVVKLIKDDSDEYEGIAKFDVNEYRQNVGQLKDNMHIDILDIAYWLKDGTYEEHARDRHEQFKD